MTKTSTVDALKSKIDGQKVVDSLGRTITLRQPTIIDRIKIAESLNFKNDETKTYVTILLYISTITSGDDILLIPHPINNQTEFYSIVGKVKDEGFNAVIRFLNEHLESDVGDEEVKK